MAMGWDLSRVVCGPAELRVDGVAVGRTEGPVRARFTPILREETSGCSGASPVDYVVIGVRAEILAPLAEYVLENVLLAMPHAVLGAAYAAVGSFAGRRLSADAASITLHPLSREAGDESEDVTLHRAVCIGAAELEYSGDADRLLEARFVGLVDFSRTDGDLIGRIASPVRT